MNENDITLIVRKYRDPDRPGLLNYLNLHHDIVALGGPAPQGNTLLADVTNVRDIMSPTVSFSKVFAAHPYWTFDPDTSIVQ